MKQLLLAITLVLTAISCSKEGPAGPAGPQGAPGPNGVAGPQGPAGNAHVKVYEKDISTMTWTALGTHSYLVVTAPTVLTAATINSSTILVYIYTSDFSGWGQVPYVTDRNIRVTADISQGQIRLRKDQNGGPTTQSWHHRLRIVIIQNTGTAQPLGRQSFTALFPEGIAAEKILPLQ